MAERAAHLTSATLETRPTIFEVLAQENLMHSIRPALQHAVKVVAESRPETFGWMLRWYDEIYTLLDFILQNYYLHYHSGSFAEDFYGLKRICDGQSSQKSLPLPEHWRSLACLVLFPYLKNKLDRWFEELRHNLNIGRAHKNKTLHRCMKVFVAVYPYIHMSWEGSLMACQMLYMFGKSPWHSPLVWLSGVRLGHQDILDTDDLEKPSEFDWSKASLQEKMKKSTSRLLNVTAQTLSTGLSVGVFFLQFLDWWYASDTNAPALMSLPVPDPPQVDTDITVPPHDICPLCLKTRTNDTALSISGYVFCYPCIHEYIKQHRCCPVTSYPASMQSLVKLYPPDT